MSIPDHPRPRTQPEHVRRREILDAAARLIVEHGYERTKIDQVAAEAGIAKGTVYLYFPSKQSLLAGLQADLASSFLDGLAEMMDDEHSSWLDRLEALARRRIEVRVAHAKLYHELFHVHAAPDGEEPLKQVRALLAEILERGDEAGEFDVEDVTLTTDFLLHASGGACDHVDRSDTAEVLLTIDRVQELFRRVVRANARGERAKWAEGSQAEPTATR
jgi:AcrR family transcriptional regulator